MATVQRRGDTYRITASAGYDTEGRQIRKSMTWRPAPGMTERQIAKELERQKVLFDEQVKGGYYSGNIKFQDFTEQWFRDYAKDNSAHPHHNGIPQADKATICRPWPYTPG